MPPWDASSRLTARECFKIRETDELTAEIAEAAETDDRKVRSSFLLICAPFPSFLSSRFQFPKFAFPSAASAISAANLLGFPAFLSSPFHIRRFVLYQCE